MVAKAAGDTARSKGLGAANEARRKIEEQRSPGAKGAHSGLERAAPVVAAAPFDYSAFQHPTPQSFEAHVQTTAAAPAAEPTKEPTAAAHAAATVGRGGGGGGGGGGEFVAVGAPV